MPDDFTWLNAQFPELSALIPMARGGQKLVFSATHRRDGDCVLKLVLPGQDVERVRREVLAVQRVNCGRVPAVLEVGTAKTPLGECVWLREQRVDGVTLREKLQNGPLGKDGLLRLGRQLLEAATAAEEARIVHRDIKPENVIVDGNGDYWLLDFGLARHLDLTSITQTAARFGVGTVGYGAPEQMRNMKRGIDARSDLFAIGIVLHEAATGSNPFIEGARDRLDALRRTERQPLPALALPFDSAGCLRDLVTTLSQKYRDQRPRTAREALEWMNEIAESLR